MLGAPQEAVPVLQGKETGWVESCGSRNGHEEMDSRNI